MDNLTSPSIEIMGSVVKLAGGCIGVGILGILLFVLLTAVRFLAASGGQK